MFLFFNCAEPLQVCWLAEPQQCDRNNEKSKHLCTVLHCNQKPQCFNSSVTNTDSNYLKLVTNDNPRPRPPHSHSQPSPTSEITAPTILFIWTMFQAVSTCDSILSTTCNTSRSLLSVSSVTQTTSPAPAHHFPQHFTILLITSNKTPRGSTVAAETHKICFLPGSLSLTAPKNVGWLFILCGYYFSVYRHRRRGEHARL